MSFFRRPLFTQPTTAAFHRLTREGLRPRSVVFRRLCGGLGDLIMILGGIQAYRRIHASQATKLHLHAPLPILDAAQNHPDLDCLHFSREKIPEDANVISLSHPCPATVGEVRIPPLLQRNRIDLFASAMGVIRPDIPRLYLAKPERLWARRWLDRFVGEDVRPVVLVWRTAQRYKDYPGIVELHARLSAAGLPVLILEHALEVPGVSTFGLTIRQQLAILEQCRFWIAGDTGWLHAGGALRRPGFGLFGSQNAVLRLAPYGVPCAWMHGTCTSGKLPCNGACMPRDEFQPCCYMDPVAVTRRILEFSEQLPAEP